jgi:xanthine dehydrogenase accessory factor
VTSTEEVLVQAARLAAEGQRYALATVVNVRPPASTRRGDRGLITADGTLTGWVGGACSEPIVVREALRALADGRPRVVRITPPAEPAPAEEEPVFGDFVIAASHCASEGIVEVLIEPQLPKPRLAVIGESPAARMLAELAATIGWRVSPELTAEADAVVVATMGRMDEDILAAVLRKDARYVGLIASARRAGVVIEALRARGLEEEQLARVRSPAGLDLGPGGQEEIAVAILAELVACFHTRTPQALAEAVDPVCGMTVAMTGAVDTFVHRGTRYWFCSPGCLASFRADPDRYAGIAEAAKPGPLSEATGR